jgi:secretion/DNA translocation related TadE-like protein
MRRPDTRTLRGVGNDAERGSGSVLMVAAIMVVVAATVVVGSLGSGYVARHRAAGAADLAALAAAEQLRHGVTDPCPTAHDVTVANGAALKECRVDGWEVEVAVTASIPGGSRWLIDPVRRARAGVDPPTAGLPADIGELGWRTPVPSGYRLTATFGQLGPHWASGRHTGLDFAAPLGTAVVASAGGTVVQAGWAGAYGNLVVIDHGAATTYYAHLAVIDVEAGTQVVAGQRIGSVGATGNATGPHLHFELRIGGVPHDPEAVLGFG